VPFGALLGASILAFPLFRRGDREIGYSLSVRRISYFRVSSQITEYYSFVYRRHQS